MDVTLSGVLGSMVFGYAVIRLAGFGPYSAEMAALQCAVGYMDAPRQDEIRRLKAELAAIVVDPYNRVVG